MEDGLAPDRGLTLGSAHDPAVFRRYDVRGKVGAGITPSLAFDVGRALGSRISRAGGETAAVARDVRHSSAELAGEVARGLASAGLTVHDLGEAPTPVLYHALYRRGFGGGVIVTGSHNPRGDNGLKLCLGKAPVHSEGLQALRTEIEVGDFVQGQGRVVEDDHQERYRADVAGLFSFRRPMRVGVDCGNGVAGPTVLPVLEALGVETVPLYCEPDGDFPNHLPDPEVPEYMADLGRTVREQGLDLGLGFDGDGDRVGVLDETGRKISADWLLALFARDLLREHPGGLVRFDVKCSDFLAGDVRAHGGEPWIGETGHSLLKRDVVARDAILGGELSGHIVFHRGYPPIDDALYCALSFLRLLDRTEGTTSELFAGFPQLASTAEIKVPCADSQKFDVVAALVERFRSSYDVLDVDGARVRLGEGAWFLVRASNTTPNLTVRFEAPELGAMLAARDVLQKALELHPEADARVLEGDLARWRI